MKSTSQSPARSAKQRGYPLRTAARALRPASVFLLALTMLLLGCTRSYFRRSADNEVYPIIGQQMINPLWTVPSRSVIPAPGSRMALVESPDRGPIPRDDPAASRYMYCAGGLRGYRHWYDRGILEDLEPEDWLESLDRNAEGNVVLSRDDIMQVALLDSREYQDRVEDVYLTALRLTLERFEFDTRWFSGTGALFRHFGTSSLPNESNRLNVDSRFGFSRNFTAGAQLFVEFANRLVWEFTGDDVHFASSGILVSLTQPLLRGAFRDVRMEALTQSERDVLYSVRDFARFRRQFYVDVHTNFLSLLSQVQGIRNGRNNLESLARNLQEHEALAIAGMVAPIQVDQVFQDYQRTQLSLLNSETALETNLDNFKVQLGLPPQTPVQLDENLLANFELNNPRLAALIERNNEFYLSFLQTDEAPSRVRLADGYHQLAEQQIELAGLLEQVRGEIGRWQQRVARRGPDTELPPVLENPDDTIDIPAQELARERQLASRIQDVLDESVELLAEDIEDTEAALVRLPSEDPETAWETLLALIGRRFRERAADIFVAQAQIRVYLIDIAPVDLTDQQAMDLALANRLDLMNARGIVVDAWRRVQVAANALEGRLDVRAQADLNTDPDSNNPIRFDASANAYEVGVEFDTPLDRIAERNVYRASQIEYQRARRRYMAVEDAVRSDIRRDLRNLEATRLGFEIARQQLVTAARQVDEAEVQLRSETAADSSITRDLLGALQSLLDARNNLIATWISFEVSRMNLYLDMDFMEIDAEGVWTNDRNDPASDLVTPEEVPVGRRHEAPVLEPLPPIG